MKIILNIIFFILLSFNSLAREPGETEITTEDGIEVFQNEKFYLLKKNVNIESDDLKLNADNVKIYFNNSLYNIKKIIADGSVNFYSKVFKVSGKGEVLEYEVEIEKLKVMGKGSELNTENISMFSDGFIQVNNLNGNFSLQGLGSKLINENVIILAESIDGNFSNNKSINEITFLKVLDDKISYIKNNDTEMYAKKINFNSDSSIIELIDNVTIIRNEEKIIGDYGTLDTKNNSYKIKSNKEAKVKVIIKNNE